jgi:hypothetical protein
MKRSCDINRLRISGEWHSEKKKDIYGEKEKDKSDDADLHGEGWAVGLPLECEQLVHRMVVLPRLGHLLQLPHGVHAARHPLQSRLPADLPAHTAHSGYGQSALTPLLSERR